MISEYEIPFQPSIGAYRFSTTIVGAPYIFDPRWNERDNAWYFDLREADLRPIAFSLKIVLGAFIGRRIRHPLFEQGVIAAQDLSGAAREATFDDLGTRVLVKYIPALDLLRRLSSAGAT